jgi:hypothetical protein
MVGAKELLTCEKQMMSQSALTVVIRQKYNYKLHYSVVAVYNLRPVLC